MRWVVVFYLGARRFQGAARWLAEGTQEVAGRCASSHHAPKVRIQDTPHQKTTMHSSHVLMIDETSGRLWRIPQTSIVASLGHTAHVSAKAWRQHVEAAKRDTYAFVNAEILDPFANQTPGHVLKSNLYTTNIPVVVYTQTVAISTPGCGAVACNFHWSLSYESHAKIQTQNPVLLRPFGMPLRPNISTMARRPSPRDILGAVPVTDFATELDAVDREFFVNTSCASYIFRDCSSSLAQYWSATKLHKECHPSRVAIQNRIGRETELRRIQNVNTLLDRSRDPAIANIVRTNADHGMRILGELMEITNADGRSQRHKRGCTGVCFFGDTGLPSELQVSILSMCVASAFASPEIRTTRRAFSAIRLTCTVFQTESSRIANTLIRSASNELQRFVALGEPMNASRMENVSAWTYRELGCPASLLLHVVYGPSASIDPFWRYLASRGCSGLSAAICAERAKRRTCTVTQTASGGNHSSRMLKLMSIATTASESMRSR